MSKPIREPSAVGDQFKQHYKTRSLQHRVIPGDWHYVGDVLDPDAPPFIAPWDNVGSGLRQLRFRNNGLGGIDIEGVVMGGTPPSAVCIIDPIMFPTPDESQPIPGTGGHDWQLDPDGTLSVIT